MRLFAVMVCLSACATTSTSKSLRDDEIKPLQMAGARCEGGACKCREIDAGGASAPFDEGAVAAGTKRFELRTGRGLDPMKVTIEGRGSLDKSTADANPSCAYVELPPGKHRVHIHATAVSPDAGQTPALFIREFGEKFQTWYDTFSFKCGGPDVCGLGDMQAWIDEVQKAPRGIHDLCGSVRVEGVRWEAERQVGVKLAELDVDLVLEVYKFKPRFPHGNHDCRGIDPQMKAEQEAADR
jgi:hypothetical protein